MDRRHFLFASAGLAGASAAGGLWSAFAGLPGAAISAPAVHDNLAVYFVRGASTGGPAPLTLQEALAKGTLTVIETGAVNELFVENAGAEEVFIQSGEIVKGGRQDRVLTVSLLLPPRSGRTPIASFCVEQGRWAPRGREDASRFAAAPAMAPSREAKLAMKAAMPPPAPPAPNSRVIASQRTDETGARQQAVWASVARTQDKLSANVGGDVRAAQSQSSLQLALESEKLKAAQGAYVAALAQAAQGDDIIGYVFAINGRINSGDVYVSNGLFRKLWPKLLDAAATEAIGEKGGASSTPPSVADVRAFLSQAESGAAREQPLAGKVMMETREGAAALFVETRAPGRDFVHRAYVAKR